LLISVFFNFLSSAAPAYRISGRKLRSDLSLHTIPVRGIFKIKAIMGSYAMLCSLHDAEEMGFFVVHPR